MSEPAYELTLFEAVNQLSHITELDVDKPIAASSHELLRTQGAFMRLNGYLQHLYTKNREELKGRDLQKGVQAMMHLARDAAAKLEKLQGAVNGSLTEYEALEQFYTSRIAKQIPGPQGEEIWEALSPDETKEGLHLLKSLESVQRDEHYELFLLHKEDHTPFFSHALLHQLRLVGDFDAAALKGDTENLFTKIIPFQNQNLYTSAEEILGRTNSRTIDYFKDAMRHKKRGLIALINQAMMALLLAADFQNTEKEGKQSRNYYADFHNFLRKGLKSSDYQELVAMEKNLEAFDLAVLGQLLYLSAAFFLRSGERKMALAFFKRLLGEKEREELLIDSLKKRDSALRAHLKNLPNGPLLRALEQLKNGEQEEGFDPIAQGNFPQQLFHITYGDQDVSVLALPSPTHQEVLEKAEVVAEFKAFLQFLGTRAPVQKYLLINLQDRTSFIEHARSQALEELHKKKEFHDSLTLITLPLETEFFWQTGPYQHVNDADAFLIEIKEQILSKELCGFFFPDSCGESSLENFVADLLPLIHCHFFSNQEILSHKNRINFIALTYQFLVLRWMEISSCDLISFTCKDAVDVGPSLTSTFFCFLRLFADENPWKSEEEAFLFWMLQTRALCHRERPMQLKWFEQFTNVLECFSAGLQKNRAQILRAFSSLYPEIKLSELRIKEA